MMGENIQNRTQILESIKKHKIITVVRTDNYRKAIDISKALIDGGLKVIEITMDCDNASMAINEISEIEGVLVIAGSVITGIRAEKAIAAGARLIVSPVNEMNLIKLCKGRKVPIITSAATPTEAYNAWKLGVNLIKIFPAKSLGGPQYIKDVLTPMSFLPLIPTGGVDLDNFVEYLKIGSVAVGMGKTFYNDDKNYSLMTKRAKTAIQKLNQYLETENSHKK